MTYRPSSRYIALHARRRPARTAVIRNGVPVSYGQLHHHLGAAVAALTRLGLRTGQTAVISHDDLYIQLLLVFAAEHLGVVTGSVRPGEGVECHAVVAAADLLLTQPDNSLPTPRRLFTITDAWVAHMLAQKTSLPPAFPATADTPLIILRSSGTTGAPKRMLLTQRMMHARLATQRHQAHGAGINGATRYLALLHMSVGSTYMAATNCLRLGAVFICDARGKALPDLLALRPTHCTILPYLLRLMLNEPALAGAAALCPGLKITTIGARLPVELRRRAATILGADIAENYGANEIGSIGVVDAAGLVTLSPGITAEITDPAGTALPPGKTGALRLRSASMINGYIDDPAATAAMFQSAWFAPGDLATITAPGKLRLVGRRSDVLNLGGMKQSCADLESRMLALPGIADIALTQITQGMEPAPVIVCIVANDKYHPGKTAARIGPMLNYPFSIHPIAAIPRTQAGKINRKALTTSLRA